jgi:predicted amidophosphoribosyltransferase
MYNSLRISDKIKMGVGAKIGINEFDFITNAPRKGASIRLYGYNQTAAMAKMISEYTGIAYMPMIKATKRYDTEQKNLSRQERAQNVRDKFELLKNVRKNDGVLKGKNILIIDDVVTTGSTLSECARVIKEAGASAVFALCAAAAFM